jgi:serine/threonine-protein kinase
MIGFRCVRGPEPSRPSAPPQRQLVAMPNVVHQRHAQAREAITAAGLNVGPLRHGFDTELAPYVILSTDPSAGELLEPGATVTLTINDP